MSPKIPGSDLDTLEDKSRAPNSTVRKVWLPVLVEMYPLNWWRVLPIGLP